MTTVEELSERILDEVILHSDIPEETIDKFIEIGLPNPIFPDELENAITHYGVLGMKWGVRKDRKREDETDQQYKDRLDRESRERTAKADRKAREKEQKRSLRSQERIEKIRTKAQLKQTQKQLDAQAKQREAQQKQQEKQQDRLEKERRKQEKKKTKSDIDKNKKESSTKPMTDQQLRDAINRMQMERNYKQLSKKPDSLGKKAFMALAVPVGLAIVKRQMTNIGNDYADLKTKKLRSKLGIPLDNKGSKASEDYVNKVVEEAFTKRGL